MNKHLILPAAILSLAFGLSACSSHDTMMKDDMGMDKKDTMMKEDTMTKEDTMMKDDMGMDKKDTAMDTEKGM